MLSFQPDPMGRGARRRFVQAVSVWAGAGALSAWGLPARAQIGTLNDAINQAGRQRMLSQRMAKAWLAIGQDIEVTRARKILRDSVALFERQLDDLKAFAPSLEIHATYTALARAWDGYRTALLGPAPDPDAVPALLALDAKVLKLAHQGTQQLEVFSGKAVGKLVNMAGRQRMLSQRTAKFFLCERWGVEVPKAQAEREKARGEFSAALQALAHAPQATDAIQANLLLARQQWVFFENALRQVAQPSGAQRRSVEVFATSEHILQIMDDVTHQFTDLT